jgi:alkylhydroperoxidase/carboxymuconolactone decarboxylase family protein YurZ
MANTDMMPGIEALDALSRSETPVLETLAMMHLDTLVNSTLDVRAYHLTRLAALVAADAPPMSYAVNLTQATEDGVSIEEMQGVLVAIAPIVGSARVVAAAGNVLRGLMLANPTEDGA